MKLTLIRHTQVNVPVGLIYGQTDVPLAETFEQESAEVLKKIEGFSFNIIYSSPLSRCKFLAEKITQPNSIQFDDRLMEMNFGIWEGKLWNNIESTSEANQWFKNYLEIACPGGESYSLLIDRIQAFIDDLKANNVQTCCVITHGGPIRAFISIIEKQSAQELFNRRIEYGEVINIEF